MIRLRHVSPLFLAVFALLPTPTQENYDSASWDLIQAGKFQEALDRLIVAAEARPNDSKAYATLAFLYTQVKDCSLAWKYFQLAEDLEYRNPDLERSVKSLCKKPKEDKREEILEVDKSERGTLLTIQFSPEQQQWPYKAKLPILKPSEDRTYCELSVTQVRKVRKLLGRIVPWLIVDKNEGWTVITTSSDGWWTVVTEIR